MDKLLLRPDEVAEALGFGRSKVYAMLASRELPAIRVGGSIRVPTDQLHQWIERQVAEAGWTGESASGT